MAAKPATPANTVTPKTQAIKPAQQAITPPDGWALKSSFGFMRYDATPAGLLVRLADVLHWLEKAHSLPRVAALEEMCKAMPPDVVSWLYWVQPVDYAKPVPVDWMWGGKTAAQIEAGRKADIADSIQKGLQREHENTRNGRFQSPWHFERVGRQITPTQPKPTQPEPTEPGLPALLKLISDQWSKPKFNRASTVDILDDRRVAPLSTLAIRVNKAFELWGWGTVGEKVVPLHSVPDSKFKRSEAFDDLCNRRAGSKGEAWAESDLKILWCEVDGLTKQWGRNDVRSFVADGIGLGSATAVSKLLNEFKARNKAWIAAQKSA